MRHFTLTKLISFAKRHADRSFQKIIFLLMYFGGLVVKKDIILFESYPELDGSSWMIYLELKKREYEKKYRLVWAVDASFSAPKDVDCVPFFGELSFKQKIARRICELKAKLILDSNRALHKKNPYTKRMYMRHGGPLKKCTAYTRSVGMMDYISTLSFGIQKIDFAEFKNVCVKKIEDIVPLGFPANDRIFENVDLFQKGFYPALCPSCSEKRFKKVIGWLPTFRQHRSGTRVDSEIVFPFGVPLIKTKEDLIRLNQVLSERNTLLAIQMHHAQASNFAKEKFSNIVLIEQNLKYQMGVSTANLMHSFDALITDYSSAYHEYVILNRPIALSIDDYEQYATKTGFVFDFFDWIKGVYLKDLSDLIRFIDDVANGIDSAKKIREEAMHRIHKHIDNKSTQRVVDFLVKNAKL